MKSEQLSAVTIKQVWKFLIPAGEKVDIRDGGRGRKHKYVNLTAMFPEHQAMMYVDVC